MSDEQRSWRGCSGARRPSYSGSGPYLVRKRDRLELTLEHRSSPAPDPFPLELATDEHGNTHLRVCPDDDESPQLPPPPLVELVRKRLTDAPQPLSRAALRRELRVNNQRLGDALLRLEQDAMIRRSSDGWTLSQRHQSQADSESDTQLSLLGS